MDPPSGARRGLRRGPERVARPLRGPWRRDGGGRRPRRRLELGVRLRPQRDPHRADRAVPSFGRQRPGGGDQEPDRLVPGTRTGSPRDQLTGRNYPESAPMEPDLLAIPYRASAGIDIYSGIARLSQTLWARRWQATPEQRDVVFLIVHPTSHLLRPYALPPLSDLGVDAVGLTTRYIGNDTCLTMENCVLDIAAAIQHLKGL